MTERTSTPVTQLLGAMARGESGAHEQLWATVYDELRRMAQQQMARERAGHTLQPTALVNEVFLHLVGDENVEWSSRRHFFGAAARAMRQICVDHARTRKRLRRGGG